MKLNDKNISHIDTKIALDEERMIVAVDVSDWRATEWSALESNYNIYCVDKHYNIIWQVKDANRILGGEDPFYYLGKNDKGEIIADRWSGHEYAIDPETGEATCTGFHK